eukprot:scaffold89202_cov69-Phaeocystis_antarctica.AAC.8
MTAVVPSELLCVASSSMLTPLPEHRCVDTPPKMADNDGTRNGDTKPASSSRYMSCFHGPSIASASRSADLENCAVTTANGKCTGIAGRSACACTSSATGRDVSMNAYSYACCCGKKRAAEREAQYTCPRVTAVPHGG